MNVPKRIVRSGNPQPSVLADAAGAADTLSVLKEGGPPSQGGHDPLAQQVMFKLEVSGRVRRGHTRNFADEAEPIICREADDLYPGAPYAEGRCPRCIARPVIARGEAETIMILEHEDRCPVMAGLLREAGVTP